MYKTFRHKELFILCVAYASDPNKLDAIFNGWAEPIKVKAAFDGYTQSPAQWYQGKLLPSTIVKVAVYPGIMEAAPLYQWERPVTEAPAAVAEGVLKW